jgi:hypothetical protein
VNEEALAHKGVCAKTERKKEKSLWIHAEMLEYKVVHTDDSDHYP